MDVELVVETRGITGKGAARSLRRSDKIPAILYGPRTEPLQLSVSAKQLEKLLKNMGEESRLLSLKVEDGGEQQIRQAIIREVQVHPVRRRFLHIDFYEVPLDQPIVVEVPVELLGEAVGVKKGGTLNLVRRMLSVRCLPGEIPEKVQIDVSGMDLGSTIHVKELVGQVSHELVEDPSITVVNIVSPEGKKEASAEEEAGA